MESRGLGMQRIIAILLLACAVVLVAGAVWWTSRPSTSQSQAMASASAMPTQQAQESTAAPQQTQAAYAPTVTDQQGLDIIHSQQRRDANDARAKGSIDAPVVMVLYSDFSCPYCTRFAKQVEPQLQDLVDNGTLRIEWRDLAQISQSSPLAAQAGIAAANQGRFWEFVSAAYGEADPSGHPEYTMDNLTALAQKAGVPDISRFQADTNDPETAAEVKQAQNDAYIASSLATAMPTTCAQPSRTRQNTSRSESSYRFPWWSIDAARTVLRHASTRFLFLRVSISREIDRSLRDILARLTHSSDPAGRSLIKRCRAD